MVTSELQKPLRVDVLNGLRELFICGATYSGLLRYILRSCDDDEFTTDLIRHYLMEAFSIPYHAEVKRHVERPANDDQYARIDTWLIPSILATRHSWMVSPAADSTVVPWWANLPLTEEASFTSGKPDWLSDASWAALCPVEQEKMAATATSCEVLGQQMLVMARLAESLQRQVSNLRSGHMAPST